MQLSKPQQVFPGTNERTLLIRGTLSQVTAAVYAVYTRLLLEDCAPVYRQIDDDDEGSTRAAAGSRSSHSCDSCHSSPASPSTSGGSSREGTPERGAEGGGDAPAAGTPGTPGSLSPFNVSPNLDTPSAVLQVKILVPEQFIGIIVGRKGGY